jgi:translation initiation factor IF-2
MSDNKEKDGKKPLSLGSGAKKTLSLKGGALPAGGRPSRGGPVVEVRRVRSARSAETPAAAPIKQAGPDTDVSDNLRNLTAEEREARAKALQEALSAPRKKSITETARENAPMSVSGKPDKPDADELRRRELEELQRIEAEEKASRALNEQKNAPFAVRGPVGGPGPAPRKAGDDEDGGSSYRDRVKKAPARQPRNLDRRNGGKLTVSQVLNEDYDRDRGPSLAAQKRAREKARKLAGPKEPAQKLYREVVIPETITVQELANRMTERAADVVKSLMKMGVMATINHTIDADTAELIVHEFGHTFKRVTEADVEDSLVSVQEIVENMQPRPPVVTIMGHVDHGKTSLLDSLRQTDVVSGEAGGITQHIGAYQIETKSGQRITFLDTPGHAAFTEMRARGANVTDIVVLVVAANDSIMPQTIEAINHAKAANVPIIVAINKVDLPDANPMKVKQDLLQHEVVVEDMGGDVQAVEISAKKKINLDKLEDAILLQAEILELKADPTRSAEGAVVESKMETGRGSVATVLVQKGTLRQGDIFVVGAEWGRVRVLIDDKGQQVAEAEPGKPVEVLGLQGTPDAGDVLNVVENEARAREIADYRARKKREVTSAGAGAGMSFEDMLAASKAQGKKSILPIVIKGDVHGSVEAIIGSLEKMAEDNDEIGVQILHSGVGAITESDITLARASNAMVIGFNVRANAQARQQAERDKVTISYYNIIYNVIDDAKAILSGMLSPSKREEYLGQAEIRQVFNITKVGKIAGCMVTTGMVKRGAGVRLLRDNVVIHDNGVLKTLKRFKDEVKEVKEGMECGMAFENYDDIKEGDIIECFEVVEEARTLA